jgi:hypothetical protein
LADRENWHTTNNLFELQQDTYSCYQQNNGKPISAIRWLAFCYQLFLAGDLSIDTVLDPCQFSLDSTFKHSKYLTWSCLTWTKLSWQNIKTYQTRRYRRPKYQWHNVSTTKCIGNKLY